MSYRVLSRGQFPPANVPRQTHYQPKLPGMEQLGTTHVGMPTGQPHLRFGLWPEDERSRNHVTGHKEEGVSTYELHPHTNEPVDPDPHMQSDGAEWAHDGMQNRVRDFHRERLSGYEVTGRFAGIGHDGENLLRGVQKLGRWDGGAKNRHEHYEGRLERGWPRDGES